MAIQKVGIEFVGSINTQSMKSAAAEMNKVISKSGASKETIKASEKELKNVIDAANQIDRILSKPKISQSDLTKLKDLTGAIGKSNIALEKTMNSFGPGITTAMAEINTKISEIEKATKKSSDAIKAGFREVTGTSYNNSAAIAKAKKAEMKVTERALEEAKTIELAKAQETVMAKEAVKAQEVALAKSEQDKLLKEYNKKYGTDLKNYQDYLKTKSTLNKKSMTPEQISSFSTLGTDMQRQESIIKAQRNKPLSQTKISQNINDIVAKNTKAEINAYENATKSFKEYDSARRSSAAQLGSVNKVAGENVQKLKEEYSILEKDSLAKHAKERELVTNANIKNSQAQAAATAALEKNQQAMIKASVKAQAFGKIADDLGGRIGRLTSTYFIWMKAIQQFNKAKSIVSGLDAEITQIGIVTRQTGDELWNTFGTFNELAQQMSTTTKQYLEGAKIFYQQGLNTAEVMSMVEATTKAAVLAGVDFRSASETLTAAIKAYNMEANQAMSVTDKFSAVGAASAADFRELSVAMEKVASQAYASGMSFDSLLGILAKGIETTREAPEAIGTGLKSIIARFQEMKENPMAQLEDGLDANRVEKALRSIGVALRDTNGQFRNMDDVFADLGAAWPTMTRNQKAYIATMAAGSRQQSRFMAIMNNYDRTLQLVRTSTNSAGEANAQYAIYEDSVQAAQQRLSNTMEKFYTQILTSDALKSLYDGLNSIMQIVSGMNPGFVALASIIGIVTTKFSTFIAAARIKAGMDVVQVGLQNKVVKGFSEMMLRIAMGTEYITANQLATLKSNVANAQSIVLDQEKAVSAGVEGAAEALSTAQTDLNTAQTALNTAEKQRNLFSTKALTLATLGWVAVAAIAIIGIIALVKHLEKQRNAVHKLAAETRKQADETKQSYQNLDSQVQRYEELSKIINKTKEEQSEYNDIVKQIAENSPNLIDGIDSEGNYILKRNEYIQEEIKLRQEAARAAEIQAYQAKLASMQSATWNATLEKGAAGQKTVDLSSKIEKQIKEFSANVSFKTAPEQNITSPYSTSISNPTIYGTEPKSFQNELTAAIANGYNKDQLEEIKNKYMVTVKKNWGESDAAFAERKRRLEAQYDSLYTNIIDLQEVRLAETRKVVSQGLYQIGQQEIDALKFSGENISNEYQDIVAGFATDVTTTAADYAKTSGEGITAAESVAKYSEHIQETWMAEAEKMRKLPGFDKALADLMKKQELGLSATEWKKELDSFQQKFGNTNSAAAVEMMNSLKNTVFDQEQFTKTLDEFVKFLPESIDETSFRTMFSGLSIKLTDSIISAVNGMNTDQAKQVYLDAINKIFSIGPNKKVIEEKLKGLNFADPAAVAELTSELQGMFENVGYSAQQAALFAQNTIDQSSQSLGSFIDRVKTLSEDLNKLKEDASKTMNITDAASAMKQYGAQNVIKVGSSYIIKQNYILQRQREIELDQAKNLEASINDLINQRKELIAAGNIETSTVVSNLDKQIKLYQDMKDELIDLTELEKERAKSALEQEQFRIFGAVTDKIKKYGEMIKDAQDGMTQTDIAIMGSEYPEFIDEVNGKLVVNIAKIKEAADAELESSKQSMKDAIVENELMVEQATNMDEYTFNTYRNTLVNQERSATVVQGLLETQQGLLNEANAALVAAKAWEELNRQRYNDISARMNAVKNIPGVSIVTEEERTFFNQFKENSETIKTRTKEIADLQTQINKYTKELDVATVADRIRAAGYDPATIKREEYIQVLKDMGIEQKKINDVLDKTNIDQVMKDLADGTTDASGAVEKLNDSLEKNYNLLEKINDFENDLSSIESRIDLKSTGAEEDIQLLEEKASKINGLIDLQKELSNARKEELQQVEDENQARYASWVQIVGENAVILDQLALSKALMSGSINQEFYDGLKQYVESYNDLSDSIKESESALVDLEKQQEDMYDSIIQQVIDTRQKLYDAILEADQTELELTQEKYDKLTEMENKYLSAVKKAIDDERKAREDASKVEDLAKKQRRLAILQKDTSGLYTAEAQKLAEEILKDQQTLQDEAIDKQLTALEQQIQIQQEQRDTQVQFLEEQIKFREDTGYYWDRVDDAIQNGPDAMLDLLTSSKEYQTSDPLVQQNQLDEFRRSVDTLSELAQGAGNGNVISAIEAAARAIVENNIEQANKIKDIEIAPAAPPDSSYAGNDESGSGDGPPANPPTRNTSIPKITSTLIPGTGGSYLLENGKIVNPIGATAIPGTSPAIYTAKDGTLFHYKEGGYVKHTGPAWVDGTSSNPEAFLNAKQTEMFAQMRDTLEQSRSFALKTGQSGISTSTSIGDIIINLQNPTNASAEQVAALVKKDILNSINNRVSMSVQNIR